MAAMEQNRLQQNDLVDAQGLFLKNTLKSIGFKYCLAEGSLYVFFSLWAKAGQLGGRLVAYR